MKILLVTPYYAPRVGGLERYAQAMAEGALQRGFEVVVVTSNHTGEAEREELINGVRVYRLRPFIRLSNTPLSLRWISRLKNIIAQENPAVINVHLPVPGIADIAIRVAGKRRVLVTYHNDLLKENNFLQAAVQGYYALVGNKTLRKAAGIICTSSHYATHSPRLRSVQHKITVIHPGIDEVLPAKSYRMSGSLHAIFVAQLDESHSWKGLSVLLRAVALAPDTHLSVVGDGSAKSRYELEARELRIENRVQFLGILQGKSLVQQLRKSDVLVLPSTNDTEGFGMVILEAAATGTPAIGSRVGGIPYAIVADKTGVLVAPKDVHALANALTALQQNRSRLKTLGEAARIRVQKHFLWDSQVDAFCALIQNTARGPIAPAPSPQLRAHRRASIVHVVSYYPPHKGGTEYAAQAIATEQARRGLDVQVLTSSQGYKATDEMQNGVRVRYLRTSTIANTPLLPGLPAALMQIPKHSIVHVHVAQAFAPEAVFATCAARRIPYVAHLHLDVGKSGSMGALLPVYKKVFLGPVLRKAAAVIVLNDRFKEFVHTQYKVPLERITVVPNGVDESFFIKPKLAISKPARITTIARLSPQKRVHILLDAIAHMHSPASLHIIGSGDLLAQLQARAAALGITHSVFFHGDKERAAVRALLAQADIFTLASEREGLPLALIEAMAAQVPVVASDVIGNHEFVADAGILIQEVNGTSMAAAFERVLRDAQLRSQLRKRGLAKAKQHRWPIIVDSILAVYARADKRA